MGAIGNMRSASQVRLLKASIGWLLGVGPEGVLVSYYGYPSCPRLPTGEPDGSGRLPNAIRPEWAGHPAFWLPQDVRSKRHNENDQQYLIRIYLELLNRGYYADPEADDGQFKIYDVFGLEGINVNDPDTRSRLLAYISGEPDPLFNSLYVNGQPTLNDDKDLLEAEAKLQYLRSELSWHYWFAMDDDRYYENVSRIMNLFNELSPDSLMQEWDEAVQAWANQQKPGMRDNVVELLSLYVDGIDRLYDNLRHLELTAKPVMPPDEIDRIMVVDEANRVTRHSSADNATQHIYNSGQEQLPAIRSMLEAWIHTAKSRAESIINTGANSSWIEHRRLIRFSTIATLEETLVGMGASPDYVLELPGELEE